MSTGTAACDFSSIWNRVVPSGSARMPPGDLQPPARSISCAPHPKAQGTFEDQRSEAPQPPVNRSSSSGFHFQCNFSRENPGSLQDHYELSKRSLGEGSFGSARTGKCINTGLMRAVKTIQIKAVKDPRRLELEIRIAKQLDHPNVVRLFETFHEDDKLHLVMELCTGGELFDRIVNEGARGLSETTAARYVKQITASICYLHAHNVAHRDVKPENFLFQSKARDAQLMCIDFGLAKIFEPGETMSTRVGTAYYVAPEVLKGRYDARCDVWSIGVITYLMLCGYAPFGGNDDSEVLKRVRRGTFKFSGREWDLVSEDAKTAIKSMLLFDYSDRPTAAQVLDSLWVRGSDGRSKPNDNNTKILDVVQRLQQFRQHTRMKRVALTAVAQQLPESETVRLGDLFRSLDRDGDGELSAEEVRHGLEMHGISAPDALEELLRKVDCNGSGRLDYTEFVAAMMDEKLCCKRDLCMAAFRVFDLDGDGVITPSELSRALSGSESGASSFGLSRTRIDNLIKEVDNNGDGTIDFQEFCEMLSPSKGGDRKSCTVPAIQAASWAQTRSPGAIRVHSEHTGLQSGSQRATPSTNEAHPASGSTACSAPATAVGATDEERKRGWRLSAGSRISSMISLARVNTKGLAGRK